MVGVYRPRAFTIPQFNRLTKTIYFSASKVSGHKPGFARGTNLPDLASLGQGAGSAEDLLAFMQTPEVSTSEKVDEKMIKDRLESSEFAIESQKKLDKYLTEEQKKWDKTMGQKGQSE